MTRFLVALATALLVMGIASSAHAEGALAAGPVLDGEQNVMALTLLDNWRAKSDANVRRIRMPSTSAKAEAEQPGEALTTYVERVWSQARVYRRPGGAELILRGKF